MNILCMDTSGPIVGVAVLCDNVLRFEVNIDARRTHSQTLMPLVEQALEAAQIEVRDVDLFAAVAGPGSFTGVRIGVATVKGLAQAMGKPCLPVNALEALALNGSWFQGAVCPILDARAGQVYCAAFGAGSGGLPERLLPDDALPLADFLVRARETRERAFFTGDGVAVHADAIRAAWPEALIAPPHLRNLRAGCAAVLAKQRAPEAIPARELEAIYLRAPQAVRERLAREANRHG